MAKQRSVCIGEDSVIKHFHAGGARAEAARLEFARQAISGQETFDLPSINEVSDTLLAMDRVQESQPVRYVLSIFSTTDGQRLAADIGGRLARLHRCFADAGGIELHHGDFSVSNILYNQSTGAFCLIDWSYPDWTGGSMLFEDYYHDIFIFLLSLFIRRPGEAKKIAKPEQIATAFIKAYEETAGITINPQELGNRIDYASSIYRGFPWQGKAKIRLYLCLPSIHRLKRFSKNRAQF